MKPILLTELNKQVIDIPRLTSLIINGKQKKTFGFINNGYEDIGLFTPYDNLGNNVFHVLAAKGVLPQILPEIFKHAQQICQREKVTITNIEPPINFLTKLVNAVNSQGFKPAHVAISYNDPAALDMLHQYGANFTIKNTAFSPVEYIFDKNTPFLTQTIKHGFATLLELICTQADSLNILKPNHLQAISQQIILSKNSAMHQFFLRLFEFYWEGILANDHENKGAIARLLDVATNYKEWGLSQQDLIKMLNLQNPSMQEKVLIKQAKQHMLYLCAKEILVNPKLKFLLEKLINSGLQDTKTLDQITQFIEKGIRPKAEEPKQEIKQVQIVEIISEKIPLQNIDQNIIQLSKQQNEGLIEKQPFSILLQKVPTELIETSLERTVEFSEYVAKVIESLGKSQESIKHAKKYLGENYTELHFLISLLYRLKSKFDAVLDLAAQELKIKPKNTADFFGEYVQTLKTSDLLAVNDQQKTNAYNLAGIYDNLLIAKLLLVRGVDVGIYKPNTNSIFEMAIASKSSQVLKYLLTEQKLIEVDWHFILCKAIKYANPQAAKHYIESGHKTIELTMDRYGVVKSGEKYTVLNKALDSLIEISEMKYYKEEEHKQKALAKIPNLVEFIKILMDNGKIYFSEEMTVIKKTSALLEKLVETINSLKHDKAAENAAFSLEQLLTALYNNDQYKMNANFDTKSETTYITHISALSDIGKQEFDKKTLIGNESVIDEQL